jgi:hypothetical protein
MDPRIEALRKQYEKTEANLIKIIRNPPPGSRSLRAWEKSMLASTRQELAILNDFNNQWVSGTIPKVYGASAVTAYEKMRLIKLKVSTEQVGQAPLKILIENATNDLATATNYVGRRIADEVRQAGLAATTEQIAEGQTVKEASKNLIDKFSQQGILSLTDKNGRNINMTSYANTVARTTIAEAMNKASLQAIMDNGHDLVFIPVSFSCCDLCATYEDRVYSISGEDNRYPTLDEEPPWHPNCTHACSPYNEDYDKDSEKTMEQSNRDYEVTDEQQASVDKYNATQKERAANVRLKNEWEAKRIEDPNGTAKTFSSFKKEQTVVSKTTEKASKVATTTKTVLTGKQKWEQLRVLHNEEVAIKKELTKAKRQLKALQPKKK